MIGYYYSAGSQAADEWRRMSEADDAKQVTQALTQCSFCVVLNKHVAWLNDSPQPRHLKYLFLLITVGRLIFCSVSDLYDFTFHYISCFSFEK